MAKCKGTTSSDLAALGHLPLKGKALGDDATTGCIVLWENSGKPSPLGEDSGRRRDEGMHLAVERLQWEAFPFRGRRLAEGQAEEVVSP